VFLLLYGANTATIYLSNPYPSLTITIIFPCPAVLPPPRRFGLAASIPEVWIQFRKSSESRHMTVESVTFYRVQYAVECLHDNPAVARHPNKKLCSGRVFCLLQAEFAVLLYNLRSPLLDLPLFLPEINSRQQASTIHQFRRPH
jgi:hypothetical protein